MKYQGKEACTFTFTGNTVEEADRLLACQVMNQNVLDIRRYEMQGMYYVSAIVEVSPKRQLLVEG